MNISEAKIEICHTSVGLLTEMLQLPDSQWANAI